MNEKITLPALVNILALATGDSKKQSEDFIKELFTLIADSLQNGESVKIKNFGVFKTTEVEARKSVNVSTGESHQIPAHRKVVFTPSKEMAAIINEPFEIFETVELADDKDAAIIDDKDTELADDKYIGLPNDKDVDSLEDNIEEVPVEEEESPIYEYQESEVQIEELVDVSEAAEESKSAGASELAEKPEAAEEHEVTAKEADDEHDVCHEADTGEKIKEAETAVVPPIPPVPPVIPQSPVVYPEQYGSEESYKVGDTAEMLANSKSSSRKKFWWFIGGVAAGIVLAWIASGLLVKYTSFNPTAIFGQSGRVDVMAENRGNDNAGRVANGREASSSVNGDLDAEVEEVIAVEPVSNEIYEEEVAPTQPSDTQSVHEPAPQKVYDTITKTRYLTTMAKDHYGNYHLWPYIYMENQTFLGHPDRIRPGTKVVIPDLKKYGVDPNNKQDIEKAKKKGVEIYARYK